MTASCSTGRAKKYTGTSNSHLKLDGVLVTTSAYVHVVAAQKLNCVVSNFSTS